MRRTLMQPLALGAFSVALLGLPSMGFAQFQAQPPQSGYQPGQHTQVVSQPVVRPNPGFTPNFFPPNYGWNGAYSPTGAALSGASDVINSQGNFMISKQQSKVIGQQAAQAQLDTQRKSFEQWQWEQSQAPKLENIRQQTLAGGVNRARNNPPQTEIWSGAALNFLLGDIQRQHATQGLSGPTIPLDENLVRHINVSTGTTNTQQGSVGMLKNGRLEWPQVLGDDTFKANRETVDGLTAQAVEQLKTSGSAMADTINMLRQGVDKLRSNLRSQVAEIPSNEYTRGIAFVNQLREAITQMAAPNAANYFNGTWQAQGQTVGELIGNMTKNGLRFAPATPGNENFYSALYQSVLAYDSGLGRLARQ